MAKRQSDAVAASLLTSWTDADTAMQIVGTSLGVFGEGYLDPTEVLSTETPLRNALFDVLLSLVEGGAVEMRTTGDERYAFRWRSDIASAGLTPNGSSTIDLAVPSPYRAELERAISERDAARQRAEAAETLAAERELQLQLVAEVARATEATPPAPSTAPATTPPTEPVEPVPVPAAETTRSAKPAPKPATRKPASKKAATKKAEPVATQPVASQPVAAEAQNAAPAKAPRRPAAKKTAAKKPAAKSAGKSEGVLYLPPPEAEAEPDIDLTVEEGNAEPRPSRRTKWAGYAIDRPRKHLAPVEPLAEDG